MSCLHLQPSEPIASESVILLFQSMPDRPFFLDISHKTHCEFIRCSTPFWTRGYFKGKCIIYIKKRCPVYKLHAMTSCSTEVSSTKRKSWFHKTIRLSHERNLCGPLLKSFSSNPLAVPWNKADKVETSIAGGCNIQTPILWDFCLAKGVDPTKPAWALWGKYELFSSLL